MRIIPVIDLKDGAVVHGIGGRREKYQPIRSALTADITPAGVARAFAERYAVEEVYLADLDAIAGGEPDWEAYEAIGRSGLRLWIDAGIGDQGRAAAIATLNHANVKSLLIGLESLTSREQLPRIVEQVGAERAAFSLDLRQGRPVTNLDAWRDAAPEAIAAEAVAAGIGRLVVLDLAHVGESRGVGGAELCRRLHERFPQVELIGGGGVRGLADLRLLAEAGCRAALVASALHDERLTAEQVSQVAAW